MTKPLYRDIIARLTLEEKASLMSGANFWNTRGIERLGIPSMMLTDGPHGLRKQGGKADNLGLNKSLPATCFPTAATLANSWDVELAKRVGVALGREAASMQVGVLLGPGLNIIRNPLGGRSFEYFSEDPYVSGKLAAAMVIGIQSTGVAACPKHFAVNSQEHLRMSIDEVVDERSLHEIYLEGFRRVVAEAQPRVIMSSYNRLNGTYTNENAHLLDDILKKSWRYDGIVVTDWGGNNDRVAGLKAGNQLEMPTTGGVTDKEIVTAVQVGELDESLLDRRVVELLTLVYGTQEAIKNAPDVDFDAHHEVAVEAARSSIVLLKNDAGSLPLAAAAKVAVIGDFARTPRYQGAGSSLVNPTRIDSAYDALFEAGVAIVGYTPGFKRFGRRSRRLIHKAVQLAARAETVLLFLGLDEASEAEGIDRTHMRLPDNQLALVTELARQHDNVIVVLSGGSPIELPFVDQVKAVVHGYLGGQGSGRAIADVLTGASNPSGKLATTYPLVYTDVPSAGYYPGQELTAEHREGVYVGYRYYDTLDVPVRFAFGHGLSYTTFEYSDIEATEAGVSCMVTNAGSVSGEEIVQVYVAPVAPKDFTPRHELKGFAKLRLEPGESRQVQVAFDDHTFARFDMRTHQWARIAGEYKVEVGASSRDIRLHATVTAVGEVLEPLYNRTDAPSYYSGDIQAVTDEEFSRLLGRPLPSAKWDRQVPLTLDDTIPQLAYQNLLGRAAYGALRLIRATLFTIGNPIAANNLMFVVNMPFNKIERLSGGKISRRKVEWFLRLVKRRASTPR